MNTVKANGITLAYRAWGPEGAPPVLLLHCRGADGADWTQIAERLAAVPRRVYAPDLRGHGRSDWPGGYACEAMRDDIHGFLDALGIGRTDLVGHSLGGTVAYLLAQHTPDRVRRLVLEDVPAPFPLDPPARPPNGPTDTCRSTGRWCATPTGSGTPPILCGGTTWGGSPCPRW